MDRSLTTVVQAFGPGPLASYVRFYLAIRSQLARVWQSVVAIENSLRDELGPFAADLAPVSHEALKILVDAPRVLPADLEVLWQPEDEAELSGLNDVYQVVGRFSFQGERDENLARVATLVALARQATVENATALQGLAALESRSLATADSLAQAESARAASARSNGTVRFDALAETVLSRAKQTVDALAAVPVPAFDDPKSAAEDFKKLRARMQQVYQTCLPFLQGAIAQLWGLVEGSLPQSFPAELPLVEDLPLELLQITPVGSEEVEKAEKTLATLAEEGASVARTKSALTEELAKLRGALEVLESRRSENAADLELAVTLHDWARTHELLNQQQQRINELEKDLSGRVTASGALAEAVTRARADLEQREAVAVEKRALFAAAQAALAELEKKEPLLFGKEEWRSKLADSRDHVSLFGSELEGLETALGQRRAELSATAVRAETAGTERSIAERSLLDARSRRTEIERNLTALAEKLGTRRPTRPVPPSETEELVLALEKQRSLFEQEGLRLKETERRHAEDGARAISRQKQIDVERQHVEARVEGARIARAEGLEAAEKRLSEQRKLAVDDHVREVLGALNKSIGQVGTVFIEPAREKLRQSTEPNFSQAERVRQATQLVAPVLARILAERAPELAAISELCDKIQKEFCDPAREACTRAWG